LRNVIERAFGQVKRRFAILRLGSETAIETQARIVLAVCYLSNFIKVREAAEEEAVEDEEENEETVYTEDALAREQRADRRAERAELVQWQDRLAQEMWDQYCDVLQARDGNVA
jgi:hypothetical protein